MKNTHLKLLTLIVLSVFLGCKEMPKNAEDKDIMANEALNTNAGIPDSWIANRVAKAKARLNQTDAGKVVWNAMEAHGGLATCTVMDHYLSDSIINHWIKVKHNAIVIKQ